MQNELSLQALSWRCIGPPRGGRVVAVAGHPTETMTFYFGGCAGGVWKTEDGGTYWENISDGYLNSAAVGAIAVADSDPNVIYIGMGESAIRGDVSYGDGVYKSTDGGQTWHHLGLEDTNHIAKIRIHPTNPDLVYVAALGHAFGPNKERGIYRSKDGGQTWEHVLFRSEKAGAIDLAMDVNNPRILYTTVWEVYRNFWELSSGGPDSSIYKSTDGGDTWTEITDNPGLPEGVKGKMGIAVSPAKPSRVWALIEAEEEKAGMYRSDDYGQTWSQVSDNRDLIHRPWYYCHVFADPQHENTVYVNNLKMWKSTDGGTAYEQITTPHGDNHDLWIDPSNTQRMVQGNDGGATVSFNGGATWSNIYNQLTGQFYHLAVDNQYPYRVYGTQQDNSSISTPSATEKGSIPWGDSYAAGTGESGYIAVKPDDPDIVYVGAVGSSPGGGGALQRYDHRTKQIRLVTVWPEAYYGWGVDDIKHRFAWTFPIQFSPHDSNVLFTCGNRVFRTTSEGSEWEAISPDLTRDDKSKFEASGGPLTLDTSGAEHYGTVFAFAESPHIPGLFWAGSDDGLMHISKDGGENWDNITPPTLPEWALISIIEPSPHDEATAYVAATRYKLDDYKPYLYKTTDFGETWVELSPNFPENEITRVVREDPGKAGLLYAGTETGLFVSYDDGANWQRFDANLPVVPIYDMVVKDTDLVVATHGRAFWVLDDVTPLHELADGVDAQAAHLFKPRDTVRQWLPWSLGLFSAPGKSYMMSLGNDVTYLDEKTPEGLPKRKILDGGQNPDDGVLLTYHLPDDLDGDVSLTILDEAGNEIQTYRDKKQDDDPDSKPRLTANIGLNRFVWDMHYPDPALVKGDISKIGQGIGPKAKPGNYQATLTVGTNTSTQPFTIIADPRVSATQADLDAQFTLALRLRDKVSETNERINQLRQIRRQIEHVLENAQLASTNGEYDALTTSGEGIVDKLNAIEAELIQTGSKTAMDRLRLPARLNAKLAALMPVITAADFAPPQQAYDVFDDISVRVDDQLSQLKTLIDDEVSDFVVQVEKANIPPISL
ncbi:MAG: glycosyl hydrolase [Chloroflexota bacterium]